MATTENFVLITGGTSGIGYELARLFAKDGSNLIIAARSEDELQDTSSKLQQEFGVQVVTFSTDLMERNAPFELYDMVKSKGLQVDVLVNDAGQGQYGEFADTDIYRELDIIQLNICAVVVLTKLFLKDMISRNHGKILNVTSIAGKTPGPLQSVYHGTKAFAHSFTEAIRNELKDTGVTVTSLLPGATDTDFFNKADMQDAKIVKEGKLADPAGVAKDGYEALLKGDDMVVSGLKNKVQVGMAAMMPDSMVAQNMHNQQKPVSEEK